MGNHPGLPGPKMHQRCNVKTTESANQIYINQDSEHDDLLCSLAMSAVVVQRLWGLRYLPDLSEFVGHDAPPPTTQQQLAALPNYQRILAEDARKKVQAGMKQEDLPEAERYAYRAIDWSAYNPDGGAEKEESDAEEQQKAVRLKKQARDRACWGDEDDVDFVEE